MRILHLIQRPQLRGAEVFAKQLAEVHTAAGHEVRLIAIFLPTASEELQFAGKPIEVLGGNETRKWIDFKAWKKLAHLIEEFQPQIIQANAADTLKYAVLSRLRYGWKKPIIYRNASVLSLWLKTPLHLWLNRWLLNKTDKIACVSKTSLQDLRNNVDIPITKLAYLPIGVHEEKLADRDTIMTYFADQYQIDTDALVVMHIGAFSPEKNQKALFEMLPTWQSEIPESIHLVLIGEGKLRKPLEVFVRDQNLEHVHFLGYRTDVLSLLIRADVVVLPSLVEGTPGVLLEAGLARVPAIAYDVGAVSECFPEELQDQRIASNDFPAFREKVKELLNLSKEERSRLGKLHHLFVKTNYSFEYVAERFLTTYASLAEERGQRDSYNSIGIN